MFIKLFLIFLFCQILIVPQKGQDSITVFRGIKWGASPAEVKLREKAEYLQQSTGMGFSSLSYKGNIAGLPARIDFSFKNDSLVEGSYLIQHIRSFSESYIMLKNFLSEKYGKPDYSNINAINPDSLWTEENPGILYTGPQYFWEYPNCFICLHSSKFIASDQTQEITITVLYVPGIKIPEYSGSRLITLDNFIIPEQLRNRANP